MLTDITQFIMLPRFSTGRRIFTLKEVLEVALIQDNAERIIELIRGAVAHDRTTLALEAQWRVRRASRSRARGRAGEIDNDIDRLLGATFSTVTTLVAALRSGPRADAGRAFLRQFFPDGAGAITNLRFEEQLGVMEEILTRLDAMTADELDALNIRVYAEELRRLVPEFERELRAQTGDELRFDVLRAARQEGHENLLLLLATIYTTHPGRDEADTAARRALTKPILEQSDRVRLRRRGRPTRPDVEVDPETGDELEDEDVDPSDPEE